MVVAAFTDEFGYQPSTVRVRWTDEIRGGASGTLYGCDAIWVRLSPGLAPSGMQLAHELAHCFADNYSHCGLCTDNSHAESWIWGEGGIVSRVNETLSAAGL